MRNRYFVIFILTCLFVFGCKTESENALVLLNEIEKLDTNQKQRIYLETIYDADQTIRESHPELKYGFDSQEAKNHRREMYRLSSINLKKIELYLETYGNPTKEKHGDKAAKTPWLIVHHSSTLKDREKNFPFLYKAYKTGNIEEDHFLFYLDRYYSMKFGKRHWMKKYKPEDKIKDNRCAWFTG